MTPEWMQAEIERITAALPKKEKDMKEVQRIAHIAYKRRNQFLLLGTVGVFLARETLI